MKVKELIDMLSKFPDVDVEVSIDMSTGDYDSGNQVFGEVYSAQNDGNFINILAESGYNNYENRNRIIREEIKIRSSYA